MHKAIRTFQSTFLAASLAASVLVFSAHANAAQRYLVVLKPHAEAPTAPVSKSGMVNMSAKYPGVVTAVSAANVKVVRTLPNLNSLVVNASEGDVLKLRGNADVVAIEKEVFHPLPRVNQSVAFIRNLTRVSFPSKATPPTSPAPSPITLAAPWGVVAVNAAKAWTASSQGRGARVMILDTGLDIRHPLLRANFEKGQDFTKDNGAGGNDITDLVGHGTHVAGTIAGVAIPTGWSGVAPQAKLLMGRVCSEEGCSNVAIAQGIEWAIQEKVDLISMSLGGASSTPVERAAIASAEAAGVTVVAASGNDGTATVGFPAALPTCISVGAVDSTLARASFSQYGPELTVVAPGVDVISSVPMGAGRESIVNVTAGGKTERVSSVTFQGAKELSQAVDLEIVFAGFGTLAEMTKAGVTGKYVLIARGGSNKIPEKIDAAIKAGAAGVVLMNNAPGLVHGALTRDGSVLPMPVAMILQETGNAIIERMKKNEKVSLSMMTARTDYDSYDGTSMATPHVSGVVALMKSVNKNLKPADVKAILQKTSKKLGPNTHNEFGAGIVDAEAAVRAAASMK